jgi:hypothetical protein
MVTPINAQEEPGNWSLALGILRNAKFFSRLPRAQDGNLHSGIEACTSPVLFKNAAFMRGDH